MFNGEIRNRNVFMKLSVFFGAKADLPMRLDLTQIQSNISIVKMITAVKCMEGFRLWLRFSDGTEGVADLSDLAGRGVFSAWNKPGVFAQAAVTEFGAVAWGDAIDLCPDALYLRVTGKTADLIPCPI